MDFLALERHRFGISRYPEKINLDPEDLRIFEIFSGLSKVSNPDSDPGSFRDFAFGIFRDFAHEIFSIGFCRGSHITIPISGISRIENFALFF